MIMAVILLLTTAIAVDFLDESNNTLVLSAARNSVSQKLSEKALLNPACLNSAVQSTSLDAGTITVNTKGCDVGVAGIADDIERKLCNYPPDGNAVISCGATDYTLKIEKV
jgi:hypothetical protein